MATSQQLAWLFVKAAKSGATYSHGSDQWRNCPERPRNQCALWSSCKLTLQTLGACVWPHVCHCVLTVLHHSEGKCAFGRCPPPIQLWRPGREPASPQRPRRQLVAGDIEKKTKSCVRGGSMRGVGLHQAKEPDIGNCFLSLPAFRSPRCQIWGACWECQKTGQLGNTATPRCSVGRGWCHQAHHCWRPRLAPDDVQLDAWVDEPGRAQKPPKTFMWKDEYIHSHMLYHHVNGCKWIVVIMPEYAKTAANDRFAGYYY